MPLRVSDFDLTGSIAQSIMFSRPNKCSSCIDLHGSTLNVPYFCINRSLLLFYSRERNMCRICYSTEGLMDFDLTGSIAQSIMVGKSNKCCGHGPAGVSSHYDCVIIPEASKMTAPSTLITGNHFCGGGDMGGLATATGVVPKTVCSKFLRLEYVSHEYWETAISVNVQDMFSSFCATFLLQI